jgi:hypothetical protein
MNKDPAFLMYSNDFLSGMADLTMEERGQYITMILLQHQKGSLSTKLIQIQFGGMPSVDVLSKFLIDSDGNYYNKRLDAEKTKRKAHSEKQRANVMKRWNKEDKPIPNKYDGITTVIPLKDENENLNTTKAKVEIYPDFEDFWDMYNKKTGNKEAIKKKFEKLPQKIKEQIIDYLPEYIESTPDKTYRKNPQTFLNNKSWEDEIIIKTKENGNNKNNYTNLKRLIEVADNQS